MTILNNHVGIRNIESLWFCTWLNENKLIYKLNICNLAPESHCLPLYNAWCVFFVPNLIGSHRNYHNLECGYFSNLLQHSWIHFSQFPNDVITLFHMFFWYSRNCYIKQAVLFSLIVTFFSFLGNWIWK